MRYAVIQAAGADIGMLVRGAIFDRLVITVEEEEGCVRITYDDGVEIYEPHDLLHVQVELSSPH